MMQLRPFRPKDEPALIDVWFESWRSVGLAEPVVTKAQLVERVPYDLSKRWRVTLAEMDGRIGGFLATCPDEGRLDQLFVHPDFQRRGMGCALFEVAREEMPGGFWLSTQVANSRARAFYERRGMVQDRMEDERVFYVLKATDKPA